MYTSAIILLWTLYVHNIRVIDIMYYYKSSVVCMRHSHTEFELTRFKSYLSSLPMLNLNEELAKLCCDFRFAHYPSKAFNRE